MNVKRRSTSGFTIMEALISLIVIGMMLSLLLPLVGGGLVRNQALGVLGLQAMDTNVGERLFRDILANVVRTPVYRISDQYVPILEGTRDRVKFRINADQQLACAAEGTVPQLELIIVNREADGGELYCEAGGSRVRLLAWEFGRGEFRYGSDGRSWADRWPQELGSNPEEAELILAASRLPLLQFRITDEEAQVISWVAAAGAEAIPDYRFNVEGEAEAPI